MVPVGLVLLHLHTVTTRYVTLPAVRCRFATTLVGYRSDSPLRLPHVRITGCLLLVLAVLPVLTHARIVRITVGCYRFTLRLRVHVRLVAVTVYTHVCVTALVTFTRVRYTFVTHGYLCGLRLVPG